MHFILMIKILDPAVLNISVGWPFYAFFKSTESAEMETESAETETPKKKKKKKKTEEVTEPVTEEPMETEVTC